MAEDSKQETTTEEQRPCKGCVWLHTPFYNNEPCSKSVQATDETPGCGEYVAGNPNVDLAVETLNRLDNTTLQIVRNLMPAYVKASKGGDEQTKLEVGIGDLVSFDVTEADKTYTVTGRVIFVTRASCRVMDMENDGEVYSVMRTMPTLKIVKRRPPKADNQSKDQVPEVVGASK